MYTHAYMHIIHYISCTCDIYILNITYMNTFCIYHFWCAAFISRDVGIHLVSFPVTLKKNFTYNLF